MSFLKNLCGFTLELGKSVGTVILILVDAVRGKNVDNPGDDD